MLRNITKISRFFFALRQNKGLALFFVTQLNINSVFSVVASEEKGIPQANQPQNS
jgi:hypothetical protein